MQYLSDQYQMLVFKLSSNDLYFYVFHLPCTLQTNCHVRHHTCCCNIFMSITEMSWFDA